MGGWCRTQAHEGCAHGARDEQSARVAARVAMPWQGARGAAPKDIGGKERYLVVKLFLRCSGRANKVRWQRF